MPEEPPIRELAQGPGEHPQDHERRLQEEGALNRLIGAGPAMQRAFAQARLAASSACPVLIRGEAGTGRETLARAIHALGPWRDLPFTAMDGAAPVVLERDHAPPAGTLFLRRPEVLPPHLQAKLVTLLDAKADRPPPRLIAATSADLAEACRMGSVLEPFVYRLTTLVIELPPLRERRPDLALLVDRLIEARGQAPGMGPAVVFRPEALKILEQYDWPGNIAELVEVLEQIQASARDSTIGPEQLPARIRRYPLRIPGHEASDPRPPLNLDQVLETVERRLIELAVRQARGNKTRAAARLQISRARLIRRMQHLGLAPPPELDAEILPDDPQPPEGVRKEAAP